MDKKDLCGILAEIRQKSSLKMKTICARMNTMPTTIYRMEKGESNCPMGNVFALAFALDYAIVIAKEKQTYVCKTNDDFIKWLKTKRSGNISQVQLAERVGVAPTTIINIEGGNNVATIDTFIKIVEALGYSVSIQPI